jgi:GNAT superfamily N-acetyltransferase
LEIQTRTWNEVDLDELAELTYDSIHASGLKLNSTKSVESVKEWLSGLEFNQGSFAILSYSDERLIGWLMLVLDEENRYTLNPWGMHPFIAPEHDNIAATRRMVESAIKLVEMEGGSRIQYFVLHSREVGEGTHTSYRELYEKQGLLPKGESVDMKIDLGDASRVPTISTEGYQLTPTMKYDMDTLYACYYDAFDAAKLDIFMLQSNEERRAYFEELASMELNSKSSLALERDEELVGFALTIPYGTDNLHLTCICIHPNHSGKGLGKHLLSNVERKTKAQGNKSMTLYTDQDIRAYHLYIKNGWKVTETYTQYRWQA